MFNPLAARKAVRYMGLTTILGSALLFSSSAIAKKEELPEVTKDGLHLVKDTKVAVAYARPGASLAGYTEIMLVDCFVELKKNWQRDYNLNEVGLEGRVSDKDAEEIKTRLAAEFKTEFTKELNKKGYKVVDAAAANVLLLRPALINVDVTAPDVGFSQGMQFVQSAGEMTLYMELYDSSTSTLLGRVIDPQADDGLAKRANRVTNKAAADVIITRWAEMLAKHLDEVKAKGSSE